MRIAVAKGYLDSMVDVHNGHVTAQQQYKNMETTPTPVYDLSQYIANVPMTCSTYGDTCIPCSSSNPMFGEDIYMQHQDFFRKMSAQLYEQIDVTAMEVDDEDDVEFLTQNNANFYNDNVDDIECGFGDSLLDAYDL